jgi:surfeit locus 1 family protein
VLRSLTRSKWALGALTVVVVAAVFIRLGVWQLNRLDERREENTIGESRLGAEPVGLDELLELTAGDFDEIEFRKALVSGVFDPSEEVLVRSQVELGQAGFHVITPLVTSSGSAVMVNRGWVPLTMDTPPVAAQPPAGVVEILGWVHLTQERPPLGPVDPPGNQTVFNRVDLDRLGGQTSHELAAVYLVELGERGDELPLLLNAPDFADEGPHLAYAIQWFGFAAIALVGFAALFRRSLRRRPDL